MKVIKKLVVRPAKKLVDVGLKPFGHQLVRTKDITDFYLHEYDSYEQYREIQIFHNIRKINSVWADKVTLDRVAKLLNERFSKKPIRGLCHGTRNGFEQNYLNELPENIEALGTDISETATSYENSLQWDFHDVNEEWIGKFDFIYTNSLDQSWQPKQAIITWMDQLQKDGVLIIEHTEAHGPQGASEMDPFGVRPTVMPYVLTMWFGDQISITHSAAQKENNAFDAWLFVVSKNVEKVEAL